MRLDYIGNGNFLDRKKNKEHSCAQVLEIIKSGCSISFVPGYSRTTRWDETKVIAELEIPDLDGIGIADAITGLSKFKRKLSDIARNRKDDLELTSRGVVIWQHSYSGNENLYQVIVEYYSESEQEMKDRLEVAEAFEKTRLSEEIDNLRLMIEENEKTLAQLIKL